MKFKNLATATPRKLTTKLLSSLVEGDPAKSSVESINLTKVR